MITVHYHRYDSDYEGVGLWTWDAGNPSNPQAVEIFPEGSDEFGPFFRFNQNGYSAVGMIPRLRQDWNSKDGGDRVWTPEHGNEVWIVSGSDRLHEDRPDVAPRLDSAYLDSDCTIHARLSHAIPLGRLSPAIFSIRTAKGATVPISGVRAMDPFSGRARRLEITTDAYLSVDATAMLLLDGYRPVEIVPRHLSMDADSFRYGGELGAVYTPTHTIFRLFSPRARAARVAIYDRAIGHDGRTEHVMEPIGQGVWEATVWGDLLNKHYTFVVTGKDKRKSVEAVDFYCHCTTGDDGRGKIVDLRHLDPAGFRQRPRPAACPSPTDAIIYEMHVRDFTIADDSGVRESLRGKYLGAAERGTRTPDGKHRTGIDHLADLGITHVQLLPVQDFDNDEDKPTYNWGYMTANFFSPEGWFATDIRSDARIREFKQLVAAFHDAGIRVILDVVYNHTGEQATFEKLAPGYYHRMRPDGSFWNGSGTGNEFRSESHLGRKLILDSCRHWIEEYRVDGFRFDLMGLVDIETMIEVKKLLHAIDPTLLLYGEPWAALGQDGVGIARITYKDVAAGTGIGCFNDNFRNALKGSPDGSDAGYIHDGSHRGGVIDGIRGGLDWAAHPAEAIQYADCHDNLTLWDKTALVLPNETPEEHMKMQMLAVGILGVSQGVMFLHGGVEFARTKGGNHNSYNAPDAVNQFEWHRLDAHHDLHQYTRAIIRLRRAHPLFRLATREEVDKRLHFLDGCCSHPAAIAFRIDGRGVPGESWREALVLINPLSTDIEFNVPDGKWNVYIQGMNHGMDPLFEDEGQVYVPARSITLLAR